MVKKIVGPAISHRKTAGLVCFLAIAAQPIRAQTADQPTSTQPPEARRQITPSWGRMKFEKASVKLNTSGSQRMESNFPIGIYDWYSPNHGVFSAKNFPLYAYIVFAYKISGNDALSLAPQLPEWTRTTRYDIEARSKDHNATKDQMRLMVQSLLATHFQLRIHPETRTVPVFAVVLSNPGRTGPQLQPHPPGDKTCSTKPSFKEVGIFPLTCAGITPLSPRTPGDIRLAARNVDFSRIVAELPAAGAKFDRQVVDQTALSGTFDFNLEWTPQPDAHGPTILGIHTDPNLATFRRALEEQLGLELVPRNAPIQVLVLDHIERPSDD